MRPQLAVFCTLAAVAAASARNSSGFAFWSDLPPRRQWLNNDGYCGEVSTIAAGLKFGQYLSQFDVRNIATGNQSKFYLVGVNDQATAKKLRLDAVEYPNTCVPDDKHTCSKKYLAWIKQMTRAGYAVTFCVYMNYWLFYGTTNPNAGDETYDHIVSVERVHSAFDDDKYHDDDVLFFSDHGLWANGATRFNFSYTFTEVQADRRQANAHNGTIYSVPARYVQGNFGIAHRGVIDTDNATVPVRVDTNVNFERPVIAPHSQVRPTPMPLILTATVPVGRAGSAGTVAGQNYVLFEYNDPSLVPTHSFNAQRANACNVTTFTADAVNPFILTRSIQSDQMVIFRAVPVTAP